MTLPDDLVRSLAQLGRWLDDLSDDWWLIGSSAAALVGAAPITVGDIDLLASPDDARRLADAWGVAIRPPRPDPLFRSEVYFQWPVPALPVDVMAGFEVRTAEGWRHLRPRTRLPVAVGGGVFHTPSVSEQIEILEMFGRPKDAPRAAALARIV